MTKQLNKYRPAYTAQFPYTDENVLMLGAYVDFIKKSLVPKPVGSMLGLGIGHATTVYGLLDLVGHSIQHLDIIEGSNEIIESFLDEVRLPAGVNIINGMFETFDTGKIYDAVEMGFILEHVDDPAVVLEYVRTKMATDSVLFAAVPNALALHRRLGQAAGLLRDPYALSEYDLQLGHKRYFDLDSFKAIIQDHGYTIDATTGLLLKPFATAQLTRLELSADIYRGLVTVGTAYPELCNGVAVRAHARGH